MNRLIPDTIFARTLLVLLIGLTVSHGLSMAFYFTDRSSALRFTGGQHVAERIATIKNILDDATQAEQTRIIQLANDPIFRITRSEIGPFIDDQQNPDWHERLLHDAILVHLGGLGAQDLRIRHVESAVAAPQNAEGSETAGPPLAGETLAISLPLKNGRWLNIATSIEASENFWSFRLALSTAIMLLAVVTLTGLVVHHLTRPLRTFAEAAQQLGTDVRASPLPEQGPREVRQAIRAFNEMQRRIRRFVDDRTQMLAAIAHDLGTPITRMRLRAEFVEDQEQQMKMLADLDDMGKMVSSFLSFARGEATSEPRVKVDLKSLLQRVSDDAADAGHSVTFQTDEKVEPYDCKPSALRRAVGNLIDNAVKFGGEAEVSLTRDNKYILIRIDDLGPGIPESVRDEVFQPFRRLETSRSKETGGTGLGLTVARTIIRAHGGDITLSNRQEGGLRAEIRLPRQKYASSRS
ncbi:ATP-binding protein [Limibacillus sp. MBR-115]|jgi:signal transduction histidine kinase|uniref:ATP-binding protein n=1 Tax=Limibacillus sp. MBR-115 TaxID=3156465 RepID=UPI00339476C9